MRIQRRLHHRILGVVPDLTGNMAGLRFSYAHKLVLAWLNGSDSIN